jgi:hypothetical protein
MRETLLRGNDKNIKVLLIPGSWGWLSVQAYAQLSGHSKRELEVPREIALRETRDAFRTFCKRAGKGASHQRHHFHFNSTDEIDIKPLSLHGDQLALPSNSTGTRVLSAVGWPSASCSSVTISTNSFVVETKVLTSGQYAKSTLQLPREGMAWPVQLS